MHGHIRFDRPPDTAGRIVSLEKDMKNAAHAPVRPQQQGGLANVDRTRQWQQWIQGRKGSNLAEFLKGQSV
jgi:hypothetical protein